MTINEIMEYERLSKMESDSLGIPILTTLDVEVCNYVTNNLINIDISKVNYGKEISFDELLDISISELSKFDDILKYNLINLYNPQNVSRRDDDLDFAASIRYDSNNLNYGETSLYYIPKNLYQVSSAFLCHEHIHSLKDTIYNEYYFNKILGETIPLFYELISFENYANLRNEILKIRMLFLLDNRTEYILFCSLIDKSVKDYSDFRNYNSLENIKLFQFVRSKVGCYLNSFYYAMILYNLYQENPTKILDLVSMVLRQEITTFQLLEYLNIYGDIRGQVFEKELCNIKKLIK